MILKEKIKKLEARLGVRIDYFEEISSTNDRASGAEYGHQSVVWAEMQTHGRGQRGNAWSSRAGENLTFSLVIRPETELQFYISKIVSVALTEALAAFGLSAEVKWPNDLYVGDRKIAGILIENDLQGARIVKSIVGIGLNVNQLEFDPALPNPTSMAREREKTIDRIAVLEAVLGRIFHGEEQLRAGNWEAIDEKYQAHLYRRTGEYAFQEPDNESFTASIAAVRPSGELVLRKSDGTEKSYLFKEVEFIQSL